MPALKFLAVATTPDPECTAKRFIPYWQSDESDCALHISNVPYFYSDQDVADLFACFGSVNSCNSEEDQQPSYSPRSCVLTYRDKASIDRALSFAATDIVQPYIHGQRSTGLDQWRQEYKESLPDVDALMETVNEFMRSFDADQAEACRNKGMKIVDEDGFELVSAQRNTKKRILPKKTGPVPPKLPKILVSDNFYLRSRMKSDRVNELAHIREQFASDKLKIQEMRRQRNFKP